MGYIDISGKYHKGTMKFAAAVPTKTSVWKQGDHDRQRADHKRDLIQPYNRDGTPNQEFIDAYPDESREIYKFIKTDEQIAKEQRNG